MAKLVAILRARSALSARDIAEMFAIYETYYEAAHRWRFEDDLSHKSHVIELRSAGRLCGFSTLEVIEAESHVAIFSGDTIIDREYWGEQDLALAFCRFAGEVKAAHPEVPLYWFLISKGYRTYRYLHVFSHAYYPNYRTAMPPELKGRLDALATRKFAGAYDADSGLIRFPESHGHLRMPWAQVRDGLLRRPEIRFFLERNPRYSRGEELACLTELTLGNLRSHAKRAFESGLLGAVRVADAA